MLDMRGTLAILGGGSLGLDRVNARASGECGCSGTKYIGHQVFSLSTFASRLEAIASRLEAASRHYQARFSFRLFPQGRNLKLAFSHFNESAYGGSSDGMFNLASMCAQSWLCLVLMPSHNN